ncbi:hypothetical protein C8Q80DRAFT_1101509 [Daedaleopsis nitida]|nr:hypothetical protein C8Q80DRAFT_1101509 [Daedaleopsis nitida]
MPTPRRHSTSTLTHGDVLANVISGLEVLEAASTVVANVPFFGSIVSGALGLAKTIERMTGTKDRYIRLARRTAELSMHIEQSLEPDPHAMSGNLRTNLIELHVLLGRIQTDVDRQLRRKPLTRFFHQSSIAATLDDHIDALDSAWRAFDVRLSLSGSITPHPGLRQFLRLFRWSDLKCLRVRGKYRVSCNDIGEEWEGAWNGRAVVVRTIKPSHSEVGVALHHPYVAQVIGYSHPALSKRFYVMDAGSCPALRGDERAYKLTTYRRDPAYGPVSRERYLHSSSQLVTTCR